MNSLEQAYASADTKKIPLETIELLHPVFVDDSGVNAPIRYVSSRCITEPVYCRLEDSAPVDAGKLVLFDPAPIAIKKPSKTNSGHADLQITLGITNREIETILDDVAEHPDPIRLFYRIYVMNPDTREVGSIQDVPFEWTMSAAVTKRGQLTASASLGDIVNRPFPYHLYTPSFAPGLVRT